ncbi:MAG: hypothetical protein WEC37_00830 [Anaerolineales bacterium]
MTLDDQKRLAAAAQAEDLEAESPRISPWAIFGLVVFVVLLLAGAGFAVFYFMQPGSPTETWRDIFIILVAFEFMVIGLALVILIVQLARLVNMLQNEVRPILDSASEAANTMRGTARFLSHNLTEPVIKASAAMATIRKGLDLFNFGRRK